MENLDLLPDYKTELDTRIPTEIEESDAFYEKSKPPRYCPSIDAKIYRF
jgi:tRNA U34 5-carboxymethylaminomethyl modifying enzyme MnmG/GidA